MMRFAGKQSFIPTNFLSTVSTTKTLCFGELNKNGCHDNKNGDKWKQEERVTLLHNTWLGRSLKLQNC